MRSVDRYRERSPALSLPAAAIGALAVGAIAMGVVAIARLAIGRMAVKNAKFGIVEIDDLTVRRLRVLEEERPVLAPNPATVSAEPR